MDGWEMYWQTNAHLMRRWSRIGVTHFGFRRLKDLANVYKSQYSSVIKSFDFLTALGPLSHLPPADSPL